MSAKTKDNALPGILVCAVGKSSSPSRPITKSCAAASKFAVHQLRTLIVLQIAWMLVNPYHTPLAFLLAIYLDMLGFAAKIAYEPRAV
jgi:hypothetical protein